MKTPIQERFSAAAQAVSRKAEAVHDKVEDVTYAVRRKVTEPIADAWDRVPYPIQTAASGTLLLLTAIGLPVLAISAAAGENPLQVIGDAMPQSNGVDVLAVPTPTETPSPIVPGVPAQQAPDFMHAIHQATTIGPTLPEMAAGLALVGTCLITPLLIANREILGEEISRLTKSLFGKNRRNPFA